MSEPQADDLDFALQAVSQARKAFALQLKGAGHFGRGEPHTLFIGVSENAPLRELAADCERAARRCGLEPETSKYTPHVTLARLRRRPGLGRLAAFEQRHALFTSEPWQVDRFGLYASQVRRPAPSLYTLEAEYPLAVA